MTTSYCGGIGGVDDNAAQAGYVVVQETETPTTITGGVTHTLTSEGADASEDGTGRGTPIVVTPLAIRGRDGGAQLEIGPEGGPYNALRAGDCGSSRQSLVAVTPTVGNGVATGMIVRRLTELECERLQGYPDEYTAGQSGSARYRQLGNSVAVPVVEWIARRVIAVDEETL